MSEQILETFWLEENCLIFSQIKLFQKQIKKLRRMK